MIVCVPSMDRWENNPIYEKVVKYAKNKERFLFFVRPYQVQQYRSYMPDVTVIPIGEECVNIGTTRRWIDSYMRSCGVSMYCQMDDRICALGTMYFDKSKTILTDSKYNKSSVDTILDNLERVSRSVFIQYPQTAILSIRRRGFANSVQESCVIDLNSSIAVIDDVLIVNTKYPLENIPETDKVSEDKCFCISSLSKGRFIGVIHLFTKETDESFVSRCEPNRENGHKYILEELPTKLNRVYGCSQWLSIEWKEKRKFPVFNLVHKYSPVPRIKLSVQDIERIINEHCN